MPVFNIVHRTTYQYSVSINESSTEIRLFPYGFKNQEVVAFQLTITGDPEVLLSTDYNGNRVGHFNITKPATTMTIEVKMLVSLSHSSKIAEIDATTIADVATFLENDIYLAQLSFPEIIENQAAIDAILSSMDCTTASITTIAQQCSAHLFEHFIYSPGLTTIETTIDEILDHKKGICQDFAHVLLQLLRTAGIPSRYVSGYICPNKSGLRGQAATHAWVEIYLPTQGWRGIDPTNNIWVTNNHVKLSVGKDFGDCSPVKGTFNGTTTSTLAVNVTIKYEDGTAYEAINEVQLSLVSPKMKKEQESAQQQ
jgi:transglutaminase-like putative cysteine protease